MTWTQALTEFAAHQITPRVREALWSRGVSDEQISLYQIGYLNRQVPEGLPEPFVKWALGGDKLEDTYVFPLTTTLGEIRGFQLRHVERERVGYSDYFVDRRECCLFGLSQAVSTMWSSGSAYLVEGNFDLFPVQRAVPSVIATLTARTNAQTARVLRRIVQRVWVGYDMDVPGRTGAEDFIAEYGGDFQVYTVTYPRVNGKQVKDPGDLWEAWGDAQMIPFIKSVMAQDAIFS